MRTKHLIIYRQAAPISFSMIKLIIVRIAYLLFFNLVNWPELYMSTDKVFWKYIWKIDLVLEIAIS